MKHRSRIVVSLSKLTHNMKVLQSVASPRVKLWPAVKANAYGHGAVPIANHLCVLGYRTLCVAHVTEALELLEAGVRADKIVVLAGMLPDEARDVMPWSHVIEPVCSAPDTMMAIAALGKVEGKAVGVHLKIDTGMGRQGILPSAFPQLMQVAESLAPQIQVRSVMSHFACADGEDRQPTLDQIGKFVDATSKGLRPGMMRHTCNSAGIFDFPQAHFDVVRPGISIYGFIPGPGTRNEAAKQLQPILKLEARVTLVKEVPRGTKVSYGHLYETKRDRTVLAAIPLGYGDGIPRCQTGKLQVVVKGVKCPQVGRITMDQLMVDVTDVPSRVSIGDYVTVIGDGITADQMAAQAGTINYEIVTQLTKRIARVHE